MITIFNGRHLITGKTGIKEASHIIVVEETLGATGISIDAVDGIASFDSDQIQTTQHSNNELIIGTVNHKGQLVILVDLAQCCTSILDKETP